MSRTYYIIIGIVFLTIIGYFYELFFCLADEGTSGESGDGESVSAED